LKGIFCPKLAVVKKYNGIRKSFSENGIQTQICIVKVGYTNDNMPMIQAYLQRIFKYVGHNPYNYTLDD
jgi:hypothetical protein